MTRYYVKNRLTGRIESSFVESKEQAQDYARQANETYQSDEYVVAEWEETR